MSGASMRNGYGGKNNAVANAAVGPGDWTRQCPRGASRTRSFPDKTTRVKYASAHRASDPRYEAPNGRPTRFRAAMFWILLSAMKSAEGSADSIKTNEYVSLFPTKLCR